jgi:hypothetical protein
MKIPQWNKWQNVKNPKPPWPYLVWCFIVQFYYIVFFKSHILSNPKCWINCTFCSWYAWGYRPKDNLGNLNHHGSIKQGYLVQFLIRQMYTPLKLAKIICYHQPHTQANGKPMHGKHNLDSIMWPYVFAPRMSQCRNPSFGLATKAKGIARVRAKRKPGS